MKKLLPTLGCVVFVAASAWMARWVAASSWESVVGYRTPYIFHAPNPVGQPLVKRVLLVVMDGVRLDSSRAMPFLNELRAGGADGVSRVGLPSLSNPGRAVLATGAWQEVNGVTNNTRYELVAVDSLFSLARGSGLKTAIAGIHFWHRNFGSLATERFPEFPVEPRYAGAGTLVEYQRNLCNGLAAFVHSSKAQFLVVDLIAADPASHDLGALSPGTGLVLKEVDDCLRRVTGEVDLAETTIIVTSDHGHIARGGHGSSEEVVMNVPLVMAGGPVRPIKGAALNAQQIDVAPTICALLGLPFSTTNQGRVLSEAFEAPPGILKSITERQERQISEFQQAQARVLGDTRDSAPITARVARTFRSTAGLLLLSLLVAWVLLEVCRDADERNAALVGLVIFYLSYFSLFSFGGLGYSLSVVNREEYLGRFFFKDMIFAGAALLAGAFALGMALSHRRGAGDNARLAAALSMLVTLSFLLQVTLAYWFNGLYMSYWMFDLGWAFKAYLDLLVVYALGFAVWLAPLPLEAAQRLRRP